MALDAEETGILVRLLARERWGCLATLDADGAPRAAMVAVVPEAGDGCLLLHLSTLSRHTRNLLERPAVSLALSEQYGGQPDPQTLARVAVQGEVREVPRDDAAFARLRAVYVAALPDAAQRFGFGDFRLVRLAATEARYIGGFARAFNVPTEALRAAVCEAAGRMAAGPGVGPTPRVDDRA